MSGRRAAIADAIGLSLMALVLVDYFRPSLLLLPTIAAGGDTPCHYPTLAWFRDHLLPQGRLHGWYPGAYLGHPLLLYYFPLPFLGMSALAGAVGLPAAFKLGIALGAMALPAAAYLALRGMGFGFPAPLLGALASLVFLFVEDNPIWGGTLASALTGEFAYAYGMALALLFLGLVYRVYARGGRPWLPAVLLAAIALAHGYAVLWAGLSASFFLYRSRQPGRTLAWLGGLAAVAFALCAFWLLPLLAGWGWTTAYDDPWITVSLANLLPRLLWPLFAAAGVGLVVMLARARRTGGPDQRLLFLLHAAVVAAALALAGPALGIVDVRFVPFAQLAVSLAGAAWVGLLLRGLFAPDLAALGLVVLGVLHADGHSRVVRYWIDWNMTGLQAKPLWPAFHQLADRLHGSVGDPRVAVEYSQEHEKAGSIRMYETLPFFSGRSTLEGVYNQASLQTHPVYYLASELSASSPNPFRSRQYSRFDTEAALRHLRLFNARDVVALSPRLVASLEARTDVEPLARIPPYTVFRLKDGPWGYVEPMAFAPVRSSPSGWRDKAYRWFTRKPLVPAHLVFTDDPRFTVVEEDEWLAPPQVPLPGGVEVKEEVEPESLRIWTSRPGHPLLVKVSYHPRWRAEGADGPFLVSPALMMVIPRQAEVRLTYGRTASDHLGLALSLAAVVGLALASWWSRRARAVATAPEPPSQYVAEGVPLLQGRPIAFLDACDLPRPGRRWGGLVPALLLVVLSTSRCTMTMGRAHRTDPGPLFEKAARAYGDGRFAEAAEYARQGLPASEGGPLHARLLTLRGRSLLAAGHAGEALESFQARLGEADRGADTAEALLGAAQAHAALGETAEADRARQRLLREFPESASAAEVRRRPAGR